MAHLIRFPGAYVPPPVLLALPTPRHAVGDAVETPYGPGVVHDRWWDGRSYTYRVKRPGGAALCCTEDVLQAALPPAPTPKPLAAPYDLARGPVADLEGPGIEIGHLLLSAAAAMAALLVVAFLAQWGVL